MSNVVKFLAQVTVEYHGLLAAISVGGGSIAGSVLGLVGAKFWNREESGPAARIRGCRYSSFSGIPESIMPDEWRPCLVIKHTVQLRWSSWLGKCCVKLRLSQARSWELSHLVGVSDEVAKLFLRRRREDDLHRSARRPSPDGRRVIPQYVTVVVAISSPDCWVIEVG